MADLAPITVEGSPTPAAPPPQQELRAIPTEDQGHVALVRDGEVKSIPQENAAKAISLGYRPASDSEYMAARDGVAGTIMAGAAGVGRGLSLGFYDPLTIEAERVLHGDKGAEEMRTMLRQLKEGHETASTVGEVGGSLATLAFGLPPVEAAAVTGEGLAARAGMRAVRAAPRLFGEGAAIAEGQQLSEDTLGNHELVAGKYLAAGLEGGILNLLLGAGLAAGGGAVADKFGGMLGKAATKAEGAVGGGLSSKLSGLAEEQAAKGLLPSASLNAAELQKLGRTAEEQSARMRRIGRTVLDEGVVTPMAGKADMATKLTAKVKEVGEELGSIRTYLEKAVVRPEAETIMRRIQEEVTLPLGQKAFSWADRSAIAPFIQELAGKTGVSAELAADGGVKLGAVTKPFQSFSELHDLRRALDGKLDSMRVWERTNGAAPGHAELKAIRGILEDEFERAAEAATTELGGDLAGKYASAKAKFADLKTAEKWVTKAAAREAQNRAFSLTDTIMAGGAIASGHPLGVLAPVGNKLLRTYGNQAAAYTLDRVAKLEALQRASTAFDSKLSSSVKAFFGDAPAPASTATATKITPAQRQALRAAVSNPAALTSHVGDMVAKTGLRDAAPNITGAVAQSIMRAATLVQQKLPREPPPIGVSFGPKPARELGPRAQAEFDRALSALDTNKTLDDFAQGRMSREQVEAIKFVNPQLYGAMQKAVRDYGMANDPDITIQKEMALAIMFDTPVSTYTRGATIRGFQQAFAQGVPSPEQAAQAGGPQPIGSGDSKAARSLASPTDQMEASDAL
jgi:hypothetical protein